MPSKKSTNRRATLRVALVEDDVSIYATVRFNYNFNQVARDIGGRWDYDRAAWRFPRHHKSDLQRILFDVFGDDGERQDVIDVRIHVVDGEYTSIRDDFSIVGFSIITPTYAPGKPNMSAGFVLEGGQIETKRRPDDDVEFDERLSVLARDVVVRANAVPRSFLTANLPSFDIEKIDATPRIEEAKKERDALLARLELLNSEIKNETK